VRWWPSSAPTRRPGSAESLAGPTTHSFLADDGLALAYHQLGTGRPVLLLHGYTGSALTNWVETGIAGRLAADGHRVIMPDMRGHGDSAKPHDADGSPRTHSRATDWR